MTWHLDQTPCWTDGDFECWKVHEGDEEECTECDEQGVSE